MEVIEIRKKIVMYVLLMLIFFYPQTAKAGEFDNAYTFYQKHGSEMSFLPGSNNQGEIYYATKAKKNDNTSIKYTTIGWKIRVLNSDGGLVQTLYCKLGGKYMTSIDVRVINGYEYCLYKVTLKDIKGRLSSAGLRALENPNSNIIFDACTTTKIKGVVQGGMTDTGPSWGKVYTTYNGIVNAQNWSSATKETLKSYYNKKVVGLYYNVSLNKGVGIASVSGEGRYCFGTTVTVKAQAADGYHFLNWTGSNTSTNEAFSFVLYGKDVKLNANAAENSYNIVFDSAGGTGSIPKQQLKYSQKLVLPSQGISNDGASLSGWKTSKDENALCFLKGQSFFLKELVNYLNLQRKNGATIVLYASWDKGPMIIADDVYVSLQDVMNGKLTENFFSKRAFAIDTEDGIIPYGINKNTAFLIENYDVNEFKKFRDGTAVTKTFLALDSAGNITRKNFNIYIVETQIYPSSMFTGKVRFISKKYYKDEKGNFISEAMGGLQEKSIWRLECDYQEILDRLFL